MGGSPNPVFIQENNLKPILYSVEFLDSIFPVYTQKKGECQKTPSLFSNEDVLKWSIEKKYMEMGDTCYPIFVPFAMDEFEQHLYLYHLRRVLAQDTMFALILWYVAKTLY